MTTKILAYIPTRSSSLGKHKNIKEFKRLPLMVHTILAAKEAGILARCL
ncbi:hypothetical protein [Helicobacter heilmannii]|nr:hypothetical protein [Helicobacter heilmannii]